jgi:hypothetical protein
MEDSEKVAIRILNATENWTNEGALQPGFL